MSISGSAQQKNNRWYAVLRIPDDTGKKRQKWIALDVPPTATKRQIDLAVEQLIASYGENTVYSRNILLADWAEQWLEHKALSGIAQTTIAGYRKNIEKHIDPYFRQRGTVLQKVKALDIQRFYDHLIREGKAPASVRRYHNVVRQMMDYAYKMGIITENPIDRVELPAPSKEKKASPYSLGEALTLLERFRGETIFPAVYLALRYGLRREEVLGLAWDKVDLERGIMYIERIVTRVDGLEIRSYPKNSSSFRCLEIGEDTREFLWELRKKQLIEQAALGEKYVEPPYDFICRLRGGKMMKPDYLSRNFNELLEKYSMRHIRFHDLRHTTGALLANSGTALQDISKLLGHADIGTTTDIYGHLSTEASARAARKMGELLTPAASI